MEIFVPCDSLLLSLDEAKTCLENIYNIRYTIRKTLIRCQKGFLIIGFHIEVPNRALNVKLCQALVIHPNWDVFICAREILLF